MVSILSWMLENHQKHLSGKPFTREAKEPLGPSHLSKAFPVTLSCHAQSTPAAQGVVFVVQARPERRRHSKGLVCCPPGNSAVSLWLQELEA